MDTENKEKQSPENYQQEEAKRNKAHVEKTPPEKIDNPVQRVPGKENAEPISEQEMEEAIKEINPDENSMDSRG